MKTLRERLDDFDVDYAELAEVARVTPQAVTNWAKRNAMGRVSAQRICEHYGRSLDWLLSNKGPKFSAAAGDKEQRGPSRAASLDEVAGRTPLELARAIARAADALARALSKGKT